MDPLSRAAGLAIVFGLLAVFAWVARRQSGRPLLNWNWRRAKTPNALRTDAALALSPHHRLHLVRCDEHRFLVLTAPGGGVIHDLNSSRPSFLPAWTDALGAAQDAPREQA